MTFSSWAVAAAPAATAQGLVIGDVERRGDPCHAAEDGYRVDHSRRRDQPVGELFDAAEEAEEPDGGQRLGQHDAHLEWAHPRRGRQAASGSPGSLRASARRHDDVAGLSPDDLARGATSLVLITPIRRRTAAGARETARVAIVRLDRTVSGVSPGSSFAVVNPDVVDVTGVSTMRAGMHYLAYLKPWSDRNGGQVKNSWLSVSGPVGIWRQTSSGSLESLWTDPAMPPITAGDVVQMPAPARTVAQVLASPASCSN